MKDLKVVLSSMASNGSNNMKPSELFKENIALTEQNLELKKELARNRNGDVEETFEEHDVEAKVSF